MISFYASKKTITVLQLHTLSNVIIWLRYALRIACPAHEGEFLPDLHGRCRLQERFPG